MRASKEPVSEEPASEESEFIHKMRALDSNVAYSAALIADPTGVSSYPGLMVAGYDMYKDPSLKNAGKLLLNAVGAIPLLGKVTKVPLTLAKGYLGLRALNKVNKALDTVPEMIPGVRKAALEVQNITSGIITNPVARRFYKPNRLNHNDAVTSRVNNSVNILNGSNSLTDFVNLVLNSREQYLK